MAIHYLCAIKGAEIVNRFSPVMVKSKSQQAGFYIIKNNFSYFNRD
jgi:hypothetical protein